MDTVDTGLGVILNPSPTTRIRKDRHRKFCWTLNNYTESDWDTMAQRFEDLGAEYIYGKEVGENGTPHLQGYAEFKNPREFSVLKALCNRAHWEVAKGNTKQNIDYCSKDGEFKTNFKMPEKPKFKIADYKWQTELINELTTTEPNDRTIIWYTDKKGGAGKSTVCRQLIIQYGALLLNGKDADCKYAVAKYWLEHEKDAKMPILIFDFARTQENYICYQAIEDLKNGQFFNTKYESTMVIYNWPHIVCFSNFEPNFSALSADRWVHRELQ